MSAAPARYAVIGHPVAHSRSPQIHTLFAAQFGIALQYARIEAPLDGFARTLRGFFDAGGRGCNVTLPFKAHAAELASVRSERVTQGGAANTLWMQGGQLMADNTDGVGLLRDLTHNLHQVLTDRRILMCGAGGAVAGVCAELLRTKPAELCIANRTLARAQALVSAHAGLAVQCGVALRACALDEIRGEFDLLINGSSAGLAGEAPPLPLHCLHAQGFAYDMVYGRGGATPFVAWARAQGWQAADGLGMLVEQAAESFLLWHGRKPDTAPVLAALRAADAGPQQQAPHA